MNAAARTTDRAEQVPSGSLADLIYDWAERYELLLFCLLLVAAITAAIDASLHKPLWYDEIFTVIVATQPTWAKFAQAMPAEGNPPLNTLLTKLCVHLFGVSQVVVRLPALLGVLGALVGLYVFVRREVGAPLGLAAVALFLGQPVWAYAYEARPYGLLMGLLMLTLVSYQSATRAVDAAPPRRRALALTGMAVGLAGCVFAHNIGVMEAGVPLLFGEIVRTWQRRRADWPVLATGLASLAALAVTAPMIRRTGQVVIAHSQIFDWPLTLTKLQGYLGFSAASLKLVADPVIFPVLLIAIVLMLRPVLPRLKRISVPAAPAYLMSAVIGTALLIPITWVAMLQARGWYFCRYGIGTILGVIILFCLLVRKGRHRQSLLITTLCGLSLVYWIGKPIRDHRHRKDLVAERFVRDDKTGLPFVVSDALYYPSVWWYAPADQKSRIVLLESPKADQSLKEAALVAEKPVVAMPMVPYADFIASHDRFLLMELGPDPDGLLQQLNSAGYSVTLLRQEDDENKLFNVQRGQPVEPRIAKAPETSK